MRWMILLALLLPATTSAQTVAANPWTRGTTLEAFLGTATATRTMDSYGGVGAGAHLYLRRHLSIRPEGTLRFVIDRSKTHRVATITLAVTYHFEEHGGMQ